MKTIIFILVLSSISFAGKKPRSYDEVKKDFCKGKRVTISERLHMLKDHNKASKNKKSVGQILSTPTKEICKDLK